MRKPVRCLENCSLIIPAEPGAMTREDVVLVVKLMAITLALGASGIAFVVGRL